MSWLKKIYKENVYGVMGALIFHIMLVSLFLLADIDMKGKMKEEPIIIEFPDVLPEPEEVPEKQEEQKQPEDIVSDQAQSLTNRASNQSALEEDNFFDEDYRNEIREAQKLVADVNKQLEKETVKLDDIEMPVASTENMDPDSIKNIVYTGKSNITYNLEGRYHVRMPVPVYLAQGGGEVTVDIVVDRRGIVLKADARKNPEIKDSQLFYYAELAAGRTTFNADPSAPAQQRGTITYHFLPQ